VISTFASDLPYRPCSTLVRHYQDMATKAKSFRSSGATPKAAQHQLREFELPVSPTNCDPELVVVRGGGRALVVDEEGCRDGGRNLFKGERRLSEVETIGKIVCRNIGVAERG
jgi:hypothetical protein